MSQSARSPGVLLSVRWGDQELAREFLRLDAPRTFTIGTDAGCDFPCAGARAFKLITIDEEGACLRHKDGTQTALQRDEPTQLALGALSFEAQLLDAPARVRTGAAAELTTVNLTLMMLAAFGFFAVAAANSDAEGASLDDELTRASARTIKMLINNNTSRQASAAAATPRQTKEKLQPVASPNRHARQPPPVRPTGRPTLSKVDVGALFKGPGAGSVFASTGLGDELRVASTGLRTAEAGSGIGVMGTGHGMDGNGLGGMSLAGIGSIGTHGGHGPNNPYGVGGMLKPMDKIPPPKWDDPRVEGCGVEGNGCLDKELIRRVIRQNLAGFRYCYESLLNRYPALEGKISVRFSIAQSGNVPSSSVASSTASNAELEQCVSERARLLRFPAGKWAGMVVVTYPFIFKQSGK